MNQKKHLPLPKKSRQNNDVTDSSEGVKFDGNKERLDLIPPELLFAVGSILTYGADKYTTIVDMTSNSVVEYLEKELEKCQIVLNVNKILMPRVGVDLVSKEICVKKILSSLNDKEKIGGNGKKEINTKFENIKKRENQTHTVFNEIEKLSEEILLKREDLQKSQIDFYFKTNKISVDFVKEIWHKLDHIWIIVTKQEKQEDIFVVSATTDLECLETLLKVLKERYSTLKNHPLRDISKIEQKNYNTNYSNNNIHTVTFTGERNWEKGMCWGRVFGACMRHMWAWWGGKQATTKNFIFGDLDTETGKSHLWHAATCIAFLITYEERKIGRDSRPK